MAITVAPETERLPWLTDDVPRPKRSANWVVAFVSASAVAVIAAISFWLGMGGTLTTKPDVRRPEARVELPPVAPSPSEQVLAQSEVEPAPVPAPVALPSQDEVRPADPPPVRRFANRAPVAVHRAGPAAAKPTRAKAKAASDKKTLNYTNPWKSRGVSGRMVRVGAYGSLEKGKEAWSRLAQLSPAIKQLPAVVTDIPSPTGRTLYWLQIGTTSQAHSEVLCQRMRAIGQRCVVVDLAGAQAQKGSKNERQPASL